jgi:hypothetical protein
MSIVDILRLHVECDSKAYHFNQHWKEAWPEARITLKSKEDYLYVVWVN